MISVIIPAFNCAHEIGALLDDIGRSRCAEVEILVVDDASTDGTAELCAENPGVRVIRQAVNAGPARARNVGAAQARGDLLFFIDSDVRLPELDVLAEMTEVFEAQPEVDCISTISNVQPRVPNAIAYNNSVYHAWYMERFLAGRPSRTGRIMFFTTRLGGIRARRFREAGGFQDALATVMNEDGEFGTRCYHLGFVTHLDRRLTNEHRYPTGFRRFIRSYFLSSAVQAMIDRSMDTSADESIAGTEKARRLFAATAPLLALTPLLGSGEAAIAAALAWFALLMASFGTMSRLIWRAVPKRTLLPWYLVYVAVTPFILAGYAWGLALSATGRSLLRTPASDLDYFADPPRGAA